MLTFLKEFIVVILFCVNFVFSALMVLSAHSDKLNPSVNPLAPYLGLTFPLFVGVVTVFLILGIMRFRACLWLSLAAFVLSYGALYAYFPIGGFASPPDNSLKIMTYNVQGYKLGSKKNRSTEKLIKYIESEQPDICCLQEADWIGEKNETEEQIGYKSAFAFYPYAHFAQFQLKKWGGYSNLVLLSRFPILSAKPIEYKSLSNGSIVYELQLPDKKRLTIVNNHLQTNSLSKEERSFYAKALGEMNIDKIKKQRFSIIKKYGDAAIVRSEQAKKIREVIDNTKGEVIVCGDFNDTQQSYAYRMIKGENLESAFVGAGFGPGVTYNNYLLIFRIDHILHSQKLKPYKSYVGDIHLSDHYPVITHLELTK